MTTAAYFARINTDRAEADRSNRILRAAAAKESVAEVSAARDAAARLIRSRYTLVIESAAWTLTNPRSADDCAKGEFQSADFGGLAAPLLTTVGAASPFAPRDYEAAINEFVKAKRGVV